MCSPPVAPSHSVFDSRLYFWTLLMPLLYLKSLHCPRVPLSWKPFIQFWHNFTRLKLVQSKFHIHSCWSWKLPTMKSNFSALEISLSVTPATCKQLGGNKMFLRTFHQFGTEVKRKLSTHFNYSSLKGLSYSPAFVSANYFLIFWDQTSCWHFFFFLRRRCPYEALKFASHVPEQVIVLRSLLKSEQMSRAAKTTMFFFFYHFTQQKF